MSKYQKSVVRKDLQPDHEHKLPENMGDTCGMLRKPNANDRAGWHTHLFQHDGDVCETDAAYEGPGHVHDVPPFGFTQGPKAKEKHEGVELARDK